MIRTLNTEEMSDIDSEVAACYAFQKSDQSKRRDWINNLTPGDELWIINNLTKQCAVRFRAFHGPRHVVVEMMHGLLRGKLKKVCRIHLRKELRLY